MQYDITIIGAGPAGLTAGIYAARAQMKTLIIEKAGIGGQIATSWEVENYPGAPDETTGPSLTERMKKQCETFGVDFRIAEYKGFEKKGKGFIVKNAEADIETKTIIIATGAQPRLLGCKGETEFRGMGVSYCATCDANFFRNLKVAVVGGGDTAIEDALYLTKFAKQVTIIHRRDALRATKILQQRAMENEKIDFLWDTVVEEIGGEGLVSFAWVKNVKTGQITKKDFDGIFIFAGNKPNTEAFEGVLDMDERHYLVTDEDMNTNVKGVFAAGDLRTKTLRQVVTATADGAIAAFNAAKYIEEVE